MKSVTILQKSNDISESLKFIYQKSSVPSFIKELADFGKCIYYLERNRKDKTLIFSTSNIDMWERSLDHIDWILDILIERNQIEIEFERSNKSNDIIEAKHFNDDFYTNLLISGGADSMCGANYYTNKLGHKIAFTHVSHRNTPSIKMLRDYILEDLEMPFFEINGTFKTEAKFRSLSGNSKDTVMNLSQTRTFFYLCNAITVNYALGIKKASITENGPLTINPPFDSTYKFTNTTNPEFIEHFNLFLSKYFGIDDLIKVYLPFKNYTKAEIMASLPNELLQKTHSCSKNYFNKYSCFNCYSCYVRRFSAYAYNNYDDDSYKPVDKEYQRYKIDMKKFLFNKKSSFFKKNSSAMFIVKFIEFCFDTLNKENDILFYDKYSKVITLEREIVDYYQNHWDLLKRYTSEMIAGIHNFFERNKKYQNEEFYIWKIFSNRMNEFYAKKILSNNFNQKIKERINERANSIVGEL